MATDAPAKKKRNRHHRPFDPTKLHDESLVTMANIAEHSSYSVKYLYNLRSRGEFIEAVRDTKRAVRFRWGDAKRWVASRPPPEVRPQHKKK